MITLNGPFPMLGEPTVIALGTFDGVHVGHQAVIRRAVASAEEHGVKSCVWCFEYPPKNFFSGGKSELLLESDEKASVISSLGVDILINTTPTRDLLQMSPDDFLSSLCSSLKARCIVTGFNFTFGAMAAGNTDTIWRFAEKNGIGFAAVSGVTSPDGHTVSSTRIRQMIHSGQVELFPYLDRRFSLRLEYESDDPTVALLPCGVITPPSGTYDVIVHFSGRKGSDGEALACEADISYIQAADEKDPTSKKSVTFSGGGIDCSGSRPVSVEFLKMKSSGD